MFMTGFNNKGFYFLVTQVSLLDLTNNLIGFSTNIFLTKMFILIFKEQKESVLTAYYNNTLVEHCMLLFCSNNWKLWRCVICV